MASPGSAAPRTGTPTAMATALQSTHSLPLLASTATHTKLKFISSFLPTLVIDRMLRSSPVVLPEETRFPASIMFVDISGFTALADRLTREQGQEGVEALNRIINSYFSVMISHINDQGGDVVKFAGDAIFVVFQPSAQQDLRTVALRAAQTALTLLDAKPENFTINGEPIVLRVHIGIGVGTAMTMHVGGVLERCEFILGGEVSSQINVAVDMAKAGQVVVSPQFWNMVKGSCSGEIASADEATEANFMLLTKVDMPVDPLPFNPRQRSLDRLVSDDVDHEHLLSMLRRYTPGAVRSRLEEGVAEWIADLRRVTILFVRLDGLDFHKPNYKNDVHTAMRTCQDVLCKYEGAVQRLQIDDKGTVLKAAYGLPPLSHEDDAIRGLMAAMDIQDRLGALGLKSSIGLTTGRVFCGTVGSTVRCEYTTVGSCVNLAARLMQNAEHDVICDPETYESAKGRLKFEYLRTIKAKGQKAPVAVYRPLKDEEGLPMMMSRGKTLGRAKEREILEERLHELVSTRRDGRRGQGAVVVVQGDAGLGKSRVVGDLYRLAQNLLAHSAHGSGDAIKKGIYLNAWRTIFKQIFGLTSEGTKEDKRGVVERFIASHLQHETGQAMGARQAVAAPSPAAPRSSRRGTGFVATLGSHSQQQQQQQQQQLPHISISPSTPGYPARTSVPGSAMTDSVTGTPVLGRKRRSSSVTGALLAERPSSRRMSQAGISGSALGVAIGGVDPLGSRRVRQGPSVSVGGPLETIPSTGDIGSPALSASSNRRYASSAADMQQVLQQHELSNGNEESPTSSSAARAVNNGSFDLDSTPGASIPRGRPASQSNAELGQSMSALPGSLNSSPVIVRRDYGADGSTGMVIGDLPSPSSAGPPPPTNRSGNAPSMGSGAPEVMLMRTPQQAPRSRRSSLTGVLFGPKRAAVASPQTASGTTNTPELARLKDDRRGSGWSLIRRGLRDIARTSPTPHSTGTQSTFSPGGVGPSNMVASPLSGASGGPGTTPVTALTTTGGGTPQLYPPLTDNPSSSIPPHLASAVGMDGSGLLSRSASIEAIQVASVNDEPLRYLSLLNSLLGLDFPETDLTSSLPASLRGRFTHDLLLRILLLAAVKQPLLLIMEDAQWVDSASWQLLLSLASAINAALPEAPLSLYLVITLRPYNNPADVPVDLSNILSQAKTTSLLLTPLSDSDIVELACRVFGVGSLPGPIENLIKQRAEGNPFVAEQLAIGLRENNLVEVRNGEVRLLVSDVLQAYPATLQAVITSRIDRLSPSTQLTIKVASVIGLAFAYQLLVDCFPVDGQAKQIHDDVQMLAKMDFIREKPNSQRLTYVFKHAITQEVCYNLTLFSQRRKLHRAIALWYEENYDPDGRMFPEMARHWQRAGDNDKAVFYLEKAGADALSKFVNQEASAYFSEALSIVGVPQTEKGRMQRASWQLGLAESSMGLGNLAKAKESLEDALELIAKPIPASRFSLRLDIFSEKWRLIFNRFMSSFRRKGREVPERRGNPSQSALKSQRRLPGDEDADVSLTVIPPIDGPVGRVNAARVYELLTEIYLTAQRPREAHLCNLRAIAHAEDNDYEDDLAQSYANASIIMGCLRQRELGEQFSEEAVTLLRSLRSTLSRDVVSVTRYVLLPTAVFFGQSASWVRASDAVDEALGNAADLSDDVALDQGMLLSAHFMFAQGELENALDDFQQVSVSARGRGDRLREANALAGMSACWIWIGWHSFARKALVRSHQLVHNDIGVGVDPGLEMVIFSQLGKLHLLSHDFRHARDLACKALEIMVQTPMPTRFECFLAYDSVCEVLLTLLGDVPEGQRGTNNHMSTMTRDNFVIPQITLAAVRRPIPELAQLAVKQLKHFAQVFPMAEPTYLINAGRLACIRGSRQSGRRLLRRAADLASDMQLKLPAWEGMAKLYLAQFAEDDVSRLALARESVTTFIDIRARYMEAKVSAVMAVIDKTSARSPVRRSEATGGSPYTTTGTTGANRGSQALPSPLQSGNLSQVTNALVQPETVRSSVVTSASFVDDEDLEGLLDPAHESKLPPAGANMYLVQLTEEELFYGQDAPKVHIS